MSNLNYLNLECRAEQTTSLKYLKYAQPCLVYGINLVKLVLDQMFSSRPKFDFIISLFISSLQQIYYLNAISNIHSFIVHTCKITY